MDGFIAVALVAGVTTAAVTPYVRRLAWRIGAVDVPGMRKVHTRPTPSLGGLGMLAGVIVALFTAGLLAGFGHENFTALYRTSSEPLGLLIAAVLIAGVGVVDDTRGLSPPAKLAGQTLAALVVVLAGVQLVHAWIPGLGVISLSPDLGVPITVLLIVAMINAVNLIDGLDGLAAGVVGIAATAFFAFAWGTHGLTDAIPNSATLVAAALVGVSLGFLIHNFHPASIFMGDTGAMMLGLLLAAAGVAHVGRTTDPAHLDFFGVFPLVMPMLVLAVAFFDAAFAVVRRLRRGKPVAAADHDHLHHRLVRRGVGHRRAVLVLYHWSIVVAFGAVGLAFFPPMTVLMVVAALTVVGVVATVAALRSGGGRGGGDGADPPSRARRAPRSRSL